MCTLSQNYGCSTFPKYCMGSKFQNLDFVWGCFPIIEIWAWSKCERSREGKDIRSNGCQGLIIKKCMVSTF